MNGERGFDPSMNESRGKRTSKLSPESFGVKLDKAITKVARSVFGHGSSEPLYDNLSGKAAESQREKMSEIKKVAEKEWLPEFKAQFLEKIEALIQSGELNITVEELDKRMSGVKISFFNQGTMASEALDAGGAYNSDQILVGIDLHGQKDDQAVKADSQHIFNHEMLHAISGALHVTRVKPSGLYRTQRERTGLKFQSTGENEFERFTWLNEALTETLALELDKNIDRDLAPYRPERTLLSLLINGPAGGGVAGVGRNKFSHAYFENYEPKDEPAERLKFWKELSRSISETYYPGFLVDIDKMIKERGIGFVISRFHVLCEGKEAK